MIDSVRPTHTLVLRLWHEPGALQGDAGWRGQVRLLEARDMLARQVCFADLADLVQAIRTLIDDADMADA